VSAIDPPLADFLSAAEVGRHYADPAVEQRAAEVSVWDSKEAAEALAQKKIAMRFLAVLDIPAEIGMRRGKRGHWGIAAGTGAAVIRGWVAEVRRIP